MRTRRRTKTATPQQRGLSTTATPTTVSVPGAVERAGGALSPDFQLISGCAAGIQTIDSTQALFLPIGASVSLLVMFFFFDSVQVVFTICTAGEQAHTGSSHQRDVARPDGGPHSRTDCSAFLPLCPSSRNHRVCIPAVANVPVPDQTLLPAEQVRRCSAAVPLFSNGDQTAPSGAAGCFRGCGIGLGFIHLRKAMLFLISNHLRGLVATSGAFSVCLLRTWRRRCF